MANLLYYVFYKPFGYLSQFTDEGNNPGLGNILDLPADIYPIGRLDKDSEGLLLLSNDKKLNFSLLNPANGHERTYWVQVDGEINEEAIQKIEQGVSIKVGKSRYLTKPCFAKIIQVPNIPERTPPVRYRKSIPTSWIEITLTEGKNRQVRKMCAAVGYPCLRLIRCKIGEIELADMQIGELKQLTKNQLSFVH